MAFLPEARPGLMVIAPGAGTRRSLTAVTSGAAFSWRSSDAPEAGSIAGSLTPMNCPTTRLRGNGAYPFWYDDSAAGSTPADHRGHEGGQHQAADSPEPGGRVVLQMPCGQQSGGAVPEPAYQAGHNRGEQRSGDHDPRDDHDEGRTHGQQRRAGAPPGRHHQRERRTERGEAGGQRDQPAPGGPGPQGVTRDPERGDADPAQ